MAEANPRETSQLAQARSFLFVPADRPERVAKALASGADACIIDLEDAVAPPAREGARDALRALWPNLPDAQRGRLLLRINANGSPWHRADVALVAELAPQGLGGVVLAKAEGVRSLQALTAQAPGVALLPLVESGAGLDALAEMSAAPGVLRLVFGHLDLQSDLGLACGPEEEEVAPARWEVVRASRRAGLAPPVDGVSTEFQQLARVRSDSARALRMGFGAKLCIHPAQVAAVHEAFTPTPAEAERARRIVEAAAAAEAANSGVCVLDGRMVDAPVIALARRTLARCR